MGKIILRLDRVMADRKMSLNELSEKVGVANVNLSSSTRMGCSCSICPSNSTFPMPLIQRLVM